MHINNNKKTADASGIICRCFWDYLSTLVIITYIPITFSFKNH